MKSLLLVRTLGAFALATAAALAADTAKSPVSRSAPAAKGGSSGKLLPDPALLDGSGNPAEKRPEHGMIGDFELPGDENAKSGRVGGGQPGQPGGQAGQPPNQSPSISVPLPNLPSLPSGQQSGAGAGSLPSIPGQQAGAGQSPDAAGLPNPSSGGGQQGAAPAGAQGAQGAQGAAGGAPGGRQVASMGGAAGAAGAQGGQDAQGGKPSPVAIGDSAMRIEPSPGMAQAGQNAQTAPNTQNHEKGTGSGGKGPAGAQSGNRVEKGRAIPAGL
jgi:hypothetical protein